MRFRTSPWRRALWALSALVAAAPAAGQTEPVVVYLVRHAEVEADGTRDPRLSAEGMERARALAALLADAGITQVHSSDYHRTRETAAAVARALALEVALYDPFDLPALARELGAAPGRHLVVGHSNTTPELVAHLGGDPHGEIDETEFDRLYVLVVSGDEATTALLRYGAPPGS